MMIVYLIQLPELSDVGLELSAAALPFSLHPPARRMGHATDVGSDATYVAACRIKSRSCTVLPQLEAAYATAATAQC